MNNAKKFLTAYQIEKRFSAIRTITAAVVAMLFCFFMIMLSSKNPGVDIITFLTAPVSSLNRFCTFLIKMSPILFTSAAICILFAADTPNLAVEGAFFIGAVASTVIGVMDGIPPVLHFILMALVGGIAAAAVLLIPAVLSLKFKANMVVSSLMLNYVCTYLGFYLLKGPLRDPAAGYEASYLIQDSAKLSKFIKVGGAEVHTGILIGMVLVGLTWVLLYKTNFGYQSRTVGSNPSFAKFSGINVGKVVIVGSILAGLVTGIGGAAEVSGYYKRLQWLASPGYGWDGIMIATLARNNPKYVIFASAFLAYVRTSADILNITSVIPIEIVQIAQQVVIVMIAARGLLHGFEKKTIVKNAQKQMQSISEEA